MLEAVRFSETSQVEPVLRPSFAVSRRVEQSIDQSLISIGSFVRFELGDLCWRRWQSGQVEAQPPSQSSTGSFGLWLQPASPKFELDEIVDCILTPTSVGRLRHFDLFDG